MRWVLGVLGGIAILVYLAMSNARSPDGSTPPIITLMAFDAALAANTENDTLLVVKATASWCPPCKEMNRTSMRDENVELFIREHGVAIELDVDDHPDAARTLRVEAMPTMIAFRKGKEIARHVGFLDARQLLAWLTRETRAE